MSWVGVVRRRFDPALTGHRRRLEFRGTLGTTETFTCYVVFGRALGIVWLRFHSGHLSPRSTVLQLNAWAQSGSVRLPTRRHLGGEATAPPNFVGVLELISRSARIVWTREIQGAREARSINVSLSAEVAPVMADIDPELSISSEKVCFIVAKAREFETKDVVTVPDEASNPSDDRMVEVLEDRADDAVFQELQSLIGAMSEDEQIDLVALAWLGRGDAVAEGWQELRGEAARVHNRRTASYLLAMPLLPNYLQDGLSELGFSCEEFEKDNL
jgi:hypothetical protein